MARASPLLALVAVILVATPCAESAITCGTAVKLVSPCINYIRNAGPLTAACCSGVKALNAAAQTTPDRRQACACLKATSASIPNLNIPLASGLPGKCGVNLPYSVTPSINCASVN